MKRALEPNGAPAIALFARKRHLCFEGEVFSSGRAGDGDTSASSEACSRGEHQRRIAALAHVARAAPGPARSGSE